MEGGLSGTQQRRGRRRLAGAEPGSGGPVSDVGGQGERARAAPGSEWALGRSAREGCGSDAKRSDVEIIVEPAPCARAAGERVLGLLPPSLSLGPSCGRPQPRTRGLRLTGDALAPSPQNGPADFLRRRGPRRGRLRLKASRPPEAQLPVRTLTLSLSRVVVVSSAIFEGDWFSHM